MLTKKQKQLLDYIKQYQAENELSSPTFDEMKEALGLASKSGVHRLIEALVERGFLRRLRFRARCLEVVHGSPTFAEPSIDHYASARAIVDAVDAARRRATKPEDAFDEVELIARVLAGGHTQHVVMN